MFIMPLSHRDSEFDESKTSEQRQFCWRMTERASTDGTDAHWNKLQEMVDKLYVSSPSTVKGMGSEPVETRTDNQLTREWLQAFLEQYKASQGRALLYHQSRWNSNSGYLVIQGALLAGLGILIKACFDKGLDSLEAWGACACGIGLSLIGIAATASWKATINEYHRHWWVDKELLQKYETLLPLPAVHAHHEKMKKHRNDSPPKKSWLLRCKFENLYLAEVHVPLLFYTIYLLLGGAMSLNLLRLLWPVIQPLFLH